MLVLSFMPVVAYGEMTPMTVEEARDFLKIDSSELTSEHIRYGSTLVGLSCELFNIVDDAQAEEFIRTKILPFHKLFSFSNDESGEAFTKVMLLNRLLLQKHSDLFDCMTDNLSKQENIYKLLVAKEQSQVIDESLLTNLLEEIKKNKGCGDLFESYKQAAGKK